MGLPRQLGRQAPDAGRVQPGPAAQPQCPARRSGRRGVRRAARASGHRRAPGVDAVRAAARGRRARSLRPAGAHRIQPRSRHRRRRSGVGRLDRALARHLDTDPEGARHHPHHHGQDRAMVGRRTPRDHRARPMDQSDLRGLGRRGRPDDRRRLGSASRRARRPCRRTDLTAHQGAQPHGHPHVLPRLPGMGMDPPPVRPEPRAGPATQRRRPDRHQPPRDRRRRVGQAAVGGVEPGPRRSARQLTPTIRWS